ncbi:hypothetical protein BROUX41_004996 [Berkeleyomyces rouxiae]|uniref:uncharacterized protein n=1 Tax=Berkeleyomyces rouxiae TaxID=2035830 RepID=UPI003B80CF41
MIVLKLLGECLTATSAITSELLAACNEPSLLSDPNCPPELAGLSFPVVQLLQRQSALLETVHHDVISRLVTGSGHAARGTGKRVESEQKALLQRRLEDVLKIAMAEFYATPFSSVLDGWRRVYADTRILMFHLRLLSGPLVMTRLGSYTEDSTQSLEKEIDTLVEILDMAIVVAGGNPVKVRDKRWMNMILGLLEGATKEATGLGTEVDKNDRPRKKLKVDRNFGDEHSMDTESLTWEDCPAFSSHEPFTPPVSNPIPQLEDYSLNAFESYLTKTPSENLVPVIFTDLINHWPAMKSRPWSKPAYLLHSTFGGRRLVPIEIGRSYVDANWTQKLLPFRAFLSEYIENTAPTSPKSQPLGRSRGYLAQHDLLAQVPSLRSDVGIPDLCWAEPSLPSSLHTHSDPRLNAWFGPPGTITPLHTDSTHNILVQVVGRKYVRLYHPKYSNVLHPRPLENGIDMSNTASVDVGVEEGWDLKFSAGEGEDEEQDKMRSLSDEEKKAFHEAEYWDCILEPGDSLYIPYGWWHYVRSLSISFSVSFWWV